MHKALALRPAAARVLGSKAGALVTPLAAVGARTQHRGFRAPLPGNGARAMSSVQKANTFGNLESSGGLGGTSGVSKRTDRKCTLVLEDGSVFSGQSFGAEVHPTARARNVALPANLAAAQCEYAVQWLLGIPTEILPSGTACEIGKLGPELLRVSGPRIRLRDAYRLPGGFGAARIGAELDRRTRSGCLRPRAHLLRSWTSVGPLPMGRS
jgi:hypothetical protein